MADTTIDLLPAYDTGYQGNHGDTIHEPCVLIISGQSIYTDSNRSLELYKLNRGVARLNTSTWTVELIRLERRVTARECTAPDIKLRERHIYNLRNADGSPTNKVIAYGKSKCRPSFFIEPVSSRATLGKLYGLRRSLRTSMKLSAVHLRRQGGYSGVALDESEPELFTVTIRNKELRMDWSDREGLLALEDMSGDKNARSACIDTLTVLVMQKVMLGGAENKRNGSTLWN